jgi:hypothetical protein
MAIIPCNGRKVYVTIQYILARIVYYTAAPQWTINNDIIFLDSTIAFMILISVVVF